MYICVTRGGGDSLGARASPPHPFTHTQVKSFLKNDYAKVKENKSINESTVSSISSAS